MKENIPEFRLRNSIHVGLTWPFKTIEKGNIYYPHWHHSLGRRVCNAILWHTVSGTFPMNQRDCYCNRKAMYINQDSGECIINSDAKNYFIKFNEDISLHVLNKIHIMKRSIRLNLFVMKCSLHYYHRQYRMSWLYTL